MSHGRFRCIGVRCLLEVILNYPGRAVAISGLTICKSECEPDVTREKNVTLNVSSMYFGPRAAVFEWVLVDFGSLSIAHGSREAVSRIYVVHPTWIWAQLHIPTLWFSHIRAAL